MKRLLAVMMLFAAMGLRAADSDSLNATVERLLKTVEKSDAIFIRNGDEHSGKEAAQHMRRKYEHFKKSIKTPEDFIEKCATKSELSDKPYKIKTADGKVVDAKDWMMGLLAEDRKKSGAGEKN
jgi:hypothetical protein